MSIFIYMIGIRREDKNVWERRAPLTPQDVGELMTKGFNFIVQPSEKRIFKDDEYRRVGALVKEDLSEADMILGIKEVPPEKILEGKVYMIFSHTVKGQPYNMPMLKRFVERECTLIDYELIKDEKGRRLIFFGKFAGNAGMIDTLLYFGKRLEYEGVPNPFTSIKHAHEYGELRRAREDIMEVGDYIRKNGLPDEIVPLVVGIAGYGHVSQGVQEVLSWLPVEEITVDELESVKKDRHRVFKVVFKEEDMVRRKEDGGFELMEYYQKPHLYEPVFQRYIPHMSILINAIYWDERYPRLLTKEYAKNFKEWRLKIIGDISCDIEGAIEITLKATDPGNPVFVYNPFKGTVEDGYEGEGIVVMAVDNLPAELAHDSSMEFSRVLKKFIPEISLKLPSNFDDWDIPPYIKRAVMVYRGEITPEYKYLEEKIKEVG